MAARSIPKPHWMPIYPANLLSDTGHLSAAIFGAYMRLQCHYWRNGPPPDDNKILARIAGMDTKEWSRVRPHIEPYFDIGGEWSHHALDAELERAYLLIKNNQKRTSAATQARRLKREADGARNAGRHVERYVEPDAERSGDVAMSQVTNKGAPATAVEGLPIVPVAETTWLSDEDYLPAP